MSNYTVIHGDLVGGRISAEYHSWHAMLQRCTNSRRANYKNYGARGITVCTRWIQFSNFLADMGRKPSTTHTLDRINSNGNYEPNNCRWATRTEQRRNRRTGLRLVTKGNETRAVSDWATVTGLSQATIIKRLNRGWSEAEAVTP